MKILSVSAIPMSDPAPREEQPYDIRADGMVHAPERPGLGYTLRADALERFRYVEGPEYAF